jgi:hypothetical protein
MIRAINLNGFGKKVDDPVERLTSPSWKENKRLVG